MRATLEEIAKILQACRERYLFVRPGGVGPALVVSKPSVCVYTVGLPEGYANVTFSAPTLNGEKITFDPSDIIASAQCEAEALAMATNLIESGNDQ